MGRMKVFAAWAFLAIATGCGTPSAERGETQTPAGRDGPYAGAGGMPAVEREQIEEETAEQKAEEKPEGGFGEAETGEGSAEGSRDPGLGGLYYFYVGLGVVLLLYLIWLIRAKPHRQEQPVVRLK